MMEESGKKRKDKEERMIEDEKEKRKTGRYTTYIYIYICEREKERKRERYIILCEEKKEERKRKDEGRPRPMIVSRCKLNCEIHTYRSRLDLCRVTNQLTNQSSQRRRSVLDRSSEGIRLFVRDIRTFHEMPCYSTPPCTFPLLSFFLYASPDFHSLLVLRSVRNTYSIPLL